MVTETEQFRNDLANLRARQKEETAALATLDDAIKTVKTLIGRSKKRLLEYEAEGKAAAAAENAKLMEDMQETLLEWETRRGRYSDNIAALGLVFGRVKVLIKLEEYDAAWEAGPWC